MSATQNSAFSGGCFGVSGSRGLEVSRSRGFGVSGFRDLEVSTFRGHEVLRPRSLDASKFSSAKKYFSADEKIFSPDENFFSPDETGALKYTVGSVPLCTAVSTRWNRPYCVPRPRIELGTKL